MCPQAERSDLWGAGNKRRGVVWLGWDSLPKAPSGERRRGLAKRCRPTPLEGGDSGDGAHAETGGGETANTHPKRGLVHPEGSTGQCL